MRGKKQAMKRFAAGLGVALAALVGAAAHERSAEAAIVERVVAVVGERPILFSELRHRARPFLTRILASSPNAAQQAAAESEMFHELLNRMIDDRLEESAADKAHLQVGTDEVDAALKNIAASAHVSVTELLAEARSQGLAEQDYRDEIRRQVLEGKLVQLRVRGRVRVTEQDARAAYQHFLKETGAQQAMDVRLLALRLNDMDPQKQKVREILAEQLASDARKGKDFCALVKSYTEDVATRDTCGSRGLTPLASLIPQLQDIVKEMRVGDVSAPIRIGNEAVVIVQLHESKMPTYEDVKPEMEQRAFAEVMERQRKMWLAELRRGVYVDVRL